MRTPTQSHGSLGLLPPHNLNPKLQGVGRARQGRAGSPCPPSLATGSRRAPDSPMRMVEGTCMEVEIYPRLPQRPRLPHTLHVPMTNPDEGGTAVVASSQSRPIWKSRCHLEPGHSSTSASATSPAPQFPRSISRRRLEAASEVGGRGPLAKNGPVFLIAGFDLLPSKPRGASRLPLSKTAAHERLQGAAPIVMGSAGEPKGKGVVGPGIKIEPPTLVIRSSPPSLARLSDITEQVPSVPSHRRST